MCISLIFTIALAYLAFLVVTSTEPLIKSLGQKQAHNQQVYDAVLDINREEEEN